MIQNESKTNPTIIKKHQKLIKIKIKCKILIQMNLTVINTKGSSSAMYKYFYKCAHKMSKSLNLY